MKDEVSVKDTCFYNHKTEKVVCMDENFDLEFDKDDGFLYNNLYIFHSVQDLVIRDLECYCDFYPNKCPLIDYTPNPEKPKKPWGFDWKPENFRNKMLEKTINTDTHLNTTHSTAASGTSPNLGEELETCQAASLRLRLEKTKFI